MQAADAYSNNVSSGVIPLQIVLIGNNDFSIPGEVKQLDAGRQVCEVFSDMIVGIDPLNCRWPYTQGQQSVDHIRFMFCLYNDADLRDFNSWLWQVVILTSSGAVVKILPVKLLPGPLDQSASSIQGSAVATAGMSAEFILQLRDAFGNAEDGSLGMNPAVTVMGSAGLALPTPVSVAYTDDGQFMIETTLTVAATYSLQVLLDGTSVDGSPLPFAVGPAAKNAQASRVQLNESVVAGVKAVVSVHAFDR